MLRFFLSLSLLFSCSAFAQTPQWFYPDSAERTQKVKSTEAFIKDYYQKQFATAHMPGAAFGVMLNGKWVYWGTAGFGNVLQQTPVTPQTVFRIASMTKSFTAMAVLQLRDKGLLALDNAASTYIPELKKLTLPQGSPVITVRHLLNHGGGWPQDDPWADRQLADSDKELLDVLQKGLQFSTLPGTAYEYSNLGFALLGRIITVVSGQPFQVYITKNILAPLGMTHTVWEWADVPPQHLAQGYRWLNGTWQKETMLHNGGAWGSMGGLLTSLEDFEKYMAFYLSAWTAAPDTENAVLKKSSLLEMQTAQRFAGLNAGYAYATGRTCAQTAAYGFGLRWTADCTGRTTVGHSGGLPGFGSNWTVLPDYGIGVVAFGNVTYAPLGGFQQQVLDTLIALSKVQRRQLKPSAVLEQRQQQLVALLPHWTNADKLPIFSENFFVDFPIDSLRKEAAVVWTRIGAVKKVHPIMPLNNLRGTFLVEGEAGSAEIFFTLNPLAAPQIQDYRIRFVER